MVSDQIVLYGLLALNIALYIPLIFAVMGRRRHRVKATNLADAFNGLELALKEAVPDLPAGFTWEEAVSRLRSSGVPTNGMENALKSYEEYRYGGVPLPNTDYDDVVRVANMLGGTSGAAIRISSSSNNNGGGGSNLGR